MATEVLPISMPLRDWLFIDAEMDNSGQNAIEVDDDAGGDEDRTQFGRSGGTRRATSPGPSLRQVAGRHRTTRSSSRLVAGLVLLDANGAHIGPADDGPGHRTRRRRP
jgi:hypothetical protein